jgi:hypothetical protein
LLRLLKLRETLIIKSTQVLFEPMSNFNLVKSPFPADSPARNDSAINQFLNLPAVSSQSLNQFIQGVKIP